MTIATRLDYGGINIMWPFFKHVLPQHEANKPSRVCQHKWADVKDADGNDLWYMKEAVYGNGNFCYTILEPYVCIHCKERKDVILEDCSWQAQSVSKAWDELEKIREKYPQIKDRAVVEDVINDMQLVDRDYLRIASKIIGLKI